MSSCSSGVEQTTDNRQARGSIPLARTNHKTDFSMKKCCTNKQWKILDTILLNLQDIDIEDVDVKEYRSRVFQRIMDMRPEKTEARIGHATDKRRRDCRV